MPFSTTIHDRKDSWPPTQVRLSQEAYYQDFDNMEEDPLTYFLTPAEYLDAGIEDKRRPRASVRHVSPSTLDELRHLSRRRISPSRFDSSSDSSDEEDYVRFRPGGYGFQPHFDSRALNRPAPISQRRSDKQQLPPVDLTIQTRGRSQKRSSHGTSSSRTVSRPTRRVWREPSPDVYSIVEDPEEDQDMLSEAGSVASERDMYERRKRSNSSRSSYEAMRHEVDEISAVPASKKKVRFAPLPRREDYL